MLVLTDSQHYINVSEDREPLTETPGKFEHVYCTLSLNVTLLCFGGPSEMSESFQDALDPLHPHWW